MLSYFRGLYHGPRAPRILITIITNGDNLSKSGAQPSFSVTLEATVEARIPLTVIPINTLLDPNGLALTRQGLTFTNVRTGELARRPVSFICPQYSSTVTVEETIDIPVHGSGPGYKVTHFFKTPSPPAEPQYQVNSGRPIYTLPADSLGLEIGEVYEIGLGESLSKVVWWKWGSKKEVFCFPFHRQSRNPGEGSPELQMVLVNRARFTIVG